MFLWVGVMDTTRAGVIATIDLNDFFADPSVSVAADGSSANFTEDASISPVLLSNNPFFGDPILIAPGAGRSLLFDFHFVEGAFGNNDVFGAFLVDGISGDPLDAPYEFSTSSTSDATVSFDLSGQVGRTLGLEFQLGSLPGDNGLDSVLMVSNVRVAVSVAQPVPEPSLILLLLAGLMGVVFRKPMLVWPRSGLAAGDLGPETTRLLTAGVVRIQPPYDRGCWPGFWGERVSGFMGAEFKPNR